MKLGLIPGAGGTQRLPRLVGRGRALFEHGEAAEGIAAFTEKRPARFA